MTARRSHRGIAPQPRTVDHAPAPSGPDPKRASCTVCGRRLHYVRRTYGPHGRAGHWQHTGDGLAQYRSW